MSKLTRNLALMVLLSSVAVSACGRDTSAAKTPEPAATPAPAPAATPPTASPPSTDAATKTVATEGAENTNRPAANEDAPVDRITQLPAQDQLPSGRWKVGLNYNPVVPTQPTNVAPGKVEVTEVFWYGCPHCYALEPYLVSWQKNKPAQAELVRVPAVWGPVQKLHARLYYTIQALGRERDLHMKVFDEVQKRGRPLIGQNEAESLKLQVAFAKANGVSEADFMKAYNSFSVNSNMQRADQLNRRYQISSVPTMVVNGKYITDTTMAGGYSNLLALLTDLVAAEKRR